ncbi:hypothetical protein RRG08_028714 [Elysia crispata]|uniref:Uncharacterized protein n=1 Tax=Elysia crispata TaxID=231223 RepID=A0AAE0XNE6_9GAST|nr:hypothetical protein RRG08_028714 [Elysia crispata]
MPAADSAVLSCAPAGPIERPMSHGRCALSGNKSRNWSLMRVPLERHLSRADNATIVYRAEPRQYLSIVLNYCEVALVKFINQSATSFYSGFERIRFQSCEAEKDESRDQMVNRVPPGSPGIFPDHLGLGLGASSSRAHP